MKKTLISLLVFFLIASPAYGAYTLYEFYQGDLPSVQERAETYSEVSGDIYEGTLEQNIALLEYLEGDGTELGFAPSTGYSQRLTASISAVVTTIPVSSTNDADGIALPCTTANRCYLNVEAGSNREERMVCTGISASAFTGCTRGLLATGDSEIGSSTLAYAHNAGASIIMTNIAQFFGNFVDYNNPLVINTFTPTDDYHLTTKTWVENRNGFWEGATTTFANLPDGREDGEARTTLDDSKIYVWASSTQSWVLAGSGGGAGTIYWTVQLGSDGTATNTVYSLDSGSWQDIKWLSVFLNGILMDEGASDDYVASTTGSQITFNSSLEDSDKVTMRVDSIDYYNPAWGSVDADIAPDTDDTYDIGSSSKQFKDLYLSGDATLGGDLSVIGTTTLATTTIPSATITATSSVTNKEYVDSRTQKASVVSATSLRTSDDGSVAITSACGTKTKQREILYNNVDGIIRTSFLLDDDGSGSVAGQIYVNGIAVGVDHSEASVATYTDDISVETGDLIQLYTCLSSSIGTTAQFRLYYDIENSPIADTVN